MMQDGLQVGLAAWIGAQRESAGFVTWPALPFATKLIDLETVHSMHDLAKAAEFARMVNFTPRKGRYAEPFAAVGVLWETHRTVLGRMVFAVRAWSAQEDAQWKTARETLYEIGSTGIPQMTPEYQLYDELRIAYADLVAAGAGAAELSAAHAAWTATGYKHEIEAALATINRLGQRSSLSEAEEQRLSLEPSRLLTSGSDAYAATAFSPLSAVREETWLSAEATLGELESAIGSNEPRRKWNAWRAARNGSVRFRYTVLDVRRSWFSPALYEADDWRLNGSPMASQGDGVNGEIPAYVVSVYLAKIDDLRTDAKPRPPKPSGPVVRPGPVPVSIATPMILTRPVERVAVSTIPPVRDPRLSLSSAPRKGVRANTSMIPRGRPELTARPVVARRLAPTTRAPNMQLRHARFGSIQRVTMLDVSTRVSLATDLINTDSRSPPATGPTSQEVYVVGFGCRKLPTSPVPNPDYEWTMSQD